MKPESLDAIMFNSVAVANKLDPGSIVSAPVLRCLEMYVRLYQSTVVSGHLGSIARHY
jgi:hypothetical protein